MPDNEDEVYAWVRYKLPRDEVAYFASEYAHLAGDEIALRKAANVWYQNALRRYLKEADEKVAEAQQERDRLAEKLTELQDEYEKEYGE